MDEQAVRDYAQALCEALVAGDIDRATADFSAELRRNLGEVIALLPLPATAATVDSLDPGFSGAGYTVDLRVASETEEVMIQTRWKERDDRPTIVEVSHLSRAAIAAQSDEAAGDDAPAEAES